MPPRALLISQIALTHPRLCERKFGEIARHFDGTAWRYRADSMGAFREVCIDIGADERFDAVGFALISGSISRTAITL